MHQLTVIHPTTGKAYPLADISADSFYIDHVYGGLDTLSFDVSPRHPLYPLCAEEAQILYGDNAYRIKTINERTDASTVSCALDLDALKQTYYPAYKSETQLLSAVLAEMLPDWSVIDADLVSIRRTLGMERVTAYDIVMQAAGTYGVCYQWSTQSKTVRVIKPELNQPSGVYLTPELNITGKALKGSTSALYTRLYPYGKDGLNITSVNDGKAYVEDFSYTNRVICASWTDERYTLAQSLKDDAIEKLKAAARPVRSYTFTVRDVAAENPQYDFLSMGLYQIAALLDPDHNTRTDHMIVGYKEYPLSPMSNVVTLSSVAAKITTKIESVVTTVVSGELAVDRQKINELSRDVDTNTARIAETYTIGETDALLESQAMQSKSEILAQVSETYATGEQVDELTDADRQIREQLASLSVTVDGVSAKTQQRGGANLLKGTAAYSLDNWEADERVSLSRGGAYASDVRQHSAAGGGFVLPTGTELAQTVTTIPDGQYCWMLRYKLTGSGAQAGAVTVGGAETALPPTSEWTQVRGNLVASGTAVDFAVSCTAGTLLVADMILMPGLEVTDWQQAQNEIMTEGMTFANGVLSIGADGEKLSTRIDNASFAVKNNAANKYEAFFDENGSEFGKTTVRGSLTVDTEARAKGLVVTPDGTGHVMFTVND